MSWLKSSKSVDNTSGKKSYFNTGAVSAPGVGYNSTWSPSRALKDAVQKVTWVYRSVDAIASNAARQPMLVRRDHPWNGETEDAPEINRVLNKRANPGEDSFMFRYRLSAQVLVSSKGAFIEVVRDQVGRVKHLYLLDPESIEVVPDPKKFVKQYRYTYQDSTGRGSQVRTLKPEQVIWIKKPNMFDPYSALTPLEATGVAVETEWLSKMYNRNFLLNDGRPGGLVVLKGDVTEGDKSELQSRFRGGPASAGRIAVISAQEGADFVDTAINPRDAQYIEGRKNTKEEILMGFGVSESVIGNAAGRSHDNAEMERLIFWMETMMPHLELIMRPLDALHEEHDSDGDLEEDGLFVSFDLSMVDVLQRAEMKKRELALKEWDAGTLSLNEVRKSRGQVEVPGGTLMVLSSTKTPYLTTDGEDVDLPSILGELDREESRNPAGRTPEADDSSVDDDEEVEREDDRLAPLANEPQKGIDTLEQKIAMLDSLSVVSETKGDEPEPVEPEESKPLDLTSGQRKSLESTAGRFLDRQSRVVGEKMSGKKMRDFLAKREEALQSEDGLKSSPALSLASAARIVYNPETWQHQLADDIRASIGEIKGVNPEDVEESEVNSALKSASVVIDEARETVSDAVCYGLIEGVEAKDISTKLDDRLASNRPSWIEAIVRSIQAEL
jgi:HK97 family phage portal protein